MRRIRGLHQMALLTLAAAFLGLPGVAVSASKGGTPFATGVMPYTGSVVVDTSCLITNVGTSPVTITSTAIQSYVGTTVPPSDDTCTSAPLPPAESVPSSAPPASMAAASPW